jgi:hypothetical protein
MPTATPFTALGRGNGFPFCGDKVDMVEEGGLSDWKVMTLKQAMEVFWLSEEWKSTATATVDATTIYSFGATPEVTIASDDLVNDIKPHERICKWDKFKRESDGYIITDDPPENVLATARFRFAPLTAFIGDYDAKFSLLRLYEGSVDNESNFRGYGFKGLFLVEGIAAINVDTGNFFLRKLVLLNSQKDVTEDYNEFIGDATTFLEVQSQDSITIGLTDAPIWAIKVEAGINLTTDPFPFSADATFTEMTPYTVV